MFQIFPCRLRFRRIQHFIEKYRRRAVHFIHPRTLDRLASRAARLFRHFKSRALGKKLNGTRISEIFRAHDTGNHVPAGAAAEAVKGFRIRKHRKGRRLFAVKRAKSLIIRAGAFQIHIRSNHVFDFISVFDLIDKALRNPHRTASPLKRISP